MINSLKIDITGIKQAAETGVRFQGIKDALVEEGATVKGYKDESGNVYMIISGDIDVETVENIFMAEAAIDVNDFVVTDEEFADEIGDEPEETEVFDNKNVKAGDKKPVNEKKGDDCCPKKKVTTKTTKPVTANKKPNYIPLTEALSGKAQKAENKDVTLDNLIDSMAGRTVSQSVLERAMERVSKNEKEQFLTEKLGEERYKSIKEAIEAGKKTLYEKVRINKKSIAEYTVEELQGMKDKLDKKILEQTGVAEAEDELNKNTRLRDILEDEISYRESLAMLTEDDEPQGFEFKNLDPNADEKEDKSEDSEEKKDDEDKSEDENKDDDEKSDEDENPDEDEEVEIGSIVITLASKEAAEDLQKDLVEAGVPEDAIEIEAADEEEDEESEDEDKSEDDEDKDENSEEEKSDEDKAEEESPKESVKGKGDKLNEADDENADDDAAGDDTDENKDDENTDDADSDDDKSDDEEEGAYKLILTDTDYVDQLSDVLENIWGMEKKEFEELIGGEIVSDDEEEDASDDDTEDNSDDNSDNKEDAAEEEPDELDFDPDEIFKDL